MKSLLIVESPAKVKTLSKFLGKDFTIKASIGHVKDLPKKDIGVDVENNFAPTYVVIEGKEKVMKDLKKAAKAADQIFLGPDPDREGEAIAWHIAEELNGDSGKLFRVEFNEITEKAVTEAIRHPRKINSNLFDAQQARRVLDRLVGYKLSPLLWRKVRRGLSAGRVQSVAVRLVVDREREIEAFKSQEYWSITATLEGKEPPQFDARLFQISGQKADINNEEQAKGIVEDLQGRSFIVTGTEKKKRKRSPSPPFITSTLQQDAARKFRFTAKKTMLIAQKLYEGIELGEEGPTGLITYMRTDSVRVASEAQHEAREFIVKKYGTDYAPPKPPVYKSKKSAQEAHEAIRPTSVYRDPADIKKFLEPDQHKLYKLVWERFVASQMESAQLEQTSIDIGADKYTFRATGTVVTFPGFMTLYIESTDNGKEEEGLLPSLSENEVLKSLGIDPKQHFTQPPPRYTEASLVKELEAKGIGRPSTYASILSTIQDRKYAEKAEGKFKPTELGVVVSDLLVERFADIMDYNFTANMEDNLDKIEEGGFKWVDVVNDFYKPFDKDLAEAMSSLGRVKPQDIPTDETCEKCGGPMVIKWGRFGRFMACSKYPECKTTKQLINAQGGEQKPQPPDDPTDEVCGKCGSPMVIKSGRFGRFIACSKYPECKTTKAIGTGVKCPEDGGEIVERRTKKGKVFFSCGNYPKCKFATWYKPVDKPCPKCGASILIEKKTKKEEVLACLKKECGYKEELEKTPEEATNDVRE
ncbi:MAG: type I DNA topoisomerase [Nitrospiraceae bacterium]|nr:MAG: type I DNA topoisomerase [Nitrospiraceae bacterium]